MNLTLTEAGLLAVLLVAFAIVYATASFVVKEEGAAFEAAPSGGSTPYERKRDDPRRRGG